MHSCGQAERRRLRGVGSTRFDPMTGPPASPRFSFSLSDTLNNPLQLPPSTSTPLPLTRLLLDRPSKQARSIYLS
jgi:hypothetical protein